MNVGEQKRIIQKDVKAALHFVGVDNLNDGAEQDGHSFGGIKGWPVGYNWKQGAWAGFYGVEEVKKGEKLALTLLLLLKVLKLTNLQNLGAVQKRVVVKVKFWCVLIFLHKGQGNEEIASFPIFC